MYLGHLGMSFVCPNSYVGVWTCISIVVSGGARARKSSFGHRSHEITTRRKYYKTPLAHLLRGPQYADWSTIHLHKGIQTLVFFYAIGDLLSTTLLKHLQNTMLLKSPTQEHMILIHLGLLIPVAALSGLHVADGGLNLWFVSPSRSIDQTTCCKWTSLSLHGLDYMWQMEV